MATVQQHYDDHLGRIYGWMIGDFDVAKEAARHELRAAGLPMRELGRDTRRVIVSRQ